MVYICMPLCVYMHSVYMYGQCLYWYIEYLLVCPSIEVIGGREIKYN